MSTPETPALRSEPLARQLTALGVWLLVINGIIGAGIFGLPANAVLLVSAIGYFWPGADDPGTRTAEQSALQ